MLRRLIALPALALVALIALATAAGAHVELDPGEATAGSTTTLTFSFHHGKDGTATTGLEVLLPEGAAVVEVPEVAGWTSTFDEEAGTISWTGGSVPDGTGAAFPVVITLPSAPGEALFKTIQTTEAGELAWIEEQESEGEGSYPSPRLTLVADPDATTTTTASEGTSTSEAATATTERPPGTSLEAAQRDDGESSLAPWVIGSGLVAILVIGAGGYALQRRRS